MKIVRLLLLPIVPVYWIVSLMRNTFYDKGVWSSKAFNFPVICVGNLSTGGTGKTPATEYLVNLLKDNYNVATLSRGYGRSTKGFLLADDKSLATTIGDEPMQIYSKYKDDIVVAVNENRVEGINQLKSQFSDIDVVVLDDAFQHRAVKAGYYILLTSYEQLYVNDFCLPTGNLREPVSGANRADVIVVTKCPKTISLEEQQKIKTLLNPKSGQEVYFSTIAYSENIKSKTTTKALITLKGTKFTLVTGIANPKPLVEFLNANDLDFNHLSYPDHHNFSANEIETLKGLPLIVTTEKDYVRLKNKLGQNDTLFYIPIAMKFIGNSEGFNKQITNFIESMN